MTDTGINIIDLQDFDKGSDGDVKMLSQPSTSRLIVRPLLSVFTHSSSSLSGLPGRAELQTAAVGAGQALPDQARTSQQPTSPYMTEQISTQRCDLFTATSNTATSSGPITSEMQIRGRIGPGLGSPRPPISVSSGEGKDGEEELDDDAKEK